MELPPVFEGGRTRSQAATLHTHEWDLVTRREDSDTLPAFTELDGNFESTTKLADEYLELLNKKRSFVLQNPKFQTGGTMINATITNLVKQLRGEDGIDNGSPAVIEHAEGSGGSPLDWIKVILGFKAQIFSRTQGTDTNDFWRARLGGYLIVISEAEWVILANTSNTHSQRCGLGNGAGD
ncbi:uncharacterized protein N7483_000152 [Penicillium malachiteum]|uniref:uncharacterized protein n=1 Tax=Penicillium malachiteum TaxID=1324776 RepID=UPI0025468DA9|nr:uncharacterized protein N7483_000152 [Penicillium malachiteum]KAJ5735027.1 hypothetical protein N7483_000152 [Penicillium malachiteum]